MTRRLSSVAFLLFVLSLFAGLPANATQIQVYGAWHCGNDFCTWASVRDMTDFDTKNHWIIDRGDGTPSVNLVVLSFVNPLKLLNQTNDSGDVNAAPIGMNSAFVNYFTSHNTPVILSIGGLPYQNFCDQAFVSKTTQLGHCVRQ